MAFVHGLLRADIKRQGFMERACTLLKEGQRSASYYKRPYSRSEPRSVISGASVDVRQQIADLREFVMEPLEDVLHSTVYSPRLRVRPTHGIAPAIDSSAAGFRMIHVIMERSRRNC